MAKLSVQLIEDKQGQLPAVLTIECSNDISDGILATTKEGFPDDYAKGGSAIVGQLEPKTESFRHGDDFTRIELPIYAAEKVQRVKDWFAGVFAERFMKPGKA